jgi:hypothetical protein
MGVIHLIAAGATADPLSPKRGFADVGANYANLQAVNAGWYYGWRPDKPSGVGNFDADFVPMIWGGHQANQFEINRILGYGDVEYVLGFNEPERPDQADMTVGEAIAGWRILSDGFTGTSVKLISPGVADTGGPDGGQAWLANFMSQATAEGLKVDGVAFHWYGASTPNDPIGAANGFISRVDSYYNSYGLPVWITEFGIIDWGGNYNDEEMRAANAIFLDNVIPRLESRSYVEGYAFYNWTGDTTLIEGSPLTPTNVGANYVGAIQGGEVYDFAGVELGEHVAYLAGGELTYTGGPAGTLRYVNALSNVSHLSGTADWGLSVGNWVRVQPAATLRKSGANRVTFGEAVVTNNGLIDVAEGELVINGQRLNGAGTVRVSQGGALHLDGAPIGRTGPGHVSHAIDLDGGTVVAPPSSNVIIATQNAVLSGDGVVAGKLVASSGTTIRVGKTGLSSQSWTPIDDFESYAAGKLNAGVTGGVWTAVFDGTANAQVVSGSGNRSLEFYGTGNSWRGAQTSLRSSFSPDDHALEDGETATYFFRVQRQGAQTIDGVFGLTDLETIGINAPWSELATTLSLFQGTQPGDTTALRAYDSDGGGDVVVRSGIGASEWINVWLVVDNANKTYEVATSTGTDGGVLFPNTFNFGRQLAIGAALDTFAGAEFRSGSNPANASVRIDDLVYLAGENLANPLSGATPSLLVEPALLRVEGDFDALAGSTLEIDLFDPTAFDRFEVTGVLAAGGTLQVSFDPMAPAPAAGDAFDVLDFASTTGRFDQFLLPTLDAGLVWDVSQLYTEGVLAVVAGLAGDYNANGVVDAADYTVWRDHVGSPPGTLPNDTDGVAIGAAQYATWKVNFGMAAGSGAGSRATLRAAVPEPTCLAVVAAGLIGCVAIVRRRP